MNRTNTPEEKGDGNTAYKTNFAERGGCGGEFIPESKGPPQYSNCSRERSEEVWSSPPPKIFCNRQELTALMKPQKTLQKRQQYDHQERGGGAPGSVQLAHVFGIPFERRSRAGMQKNARLKPRKKTGSVINRQPNDGVGFPGFQIKTEKRGENFLRVLRRNKIRGVFLSGPKKRLLGMRVAKASRPSSNFKFEEKSKKTKQSAKGMSVSIKKEKHREIPGQGPKKSEG